MNFNPEDRFIFFQLHWEKIMFIEKMSHFLTKFHACDKKKCKTNKILHFFRNKSVDRIVENLIKLNFFIAPNNNWLLQTWYTFENILKLRAFFS